MAQFTKDQEVTIHNINQEREACGMPSIETVLEAKKVKFIQYEGYVNSKLHKKQIRQCRVTGVRVSRTIDKTNTCEISELLIPETALF